MPLTGLKTPYTWLEITHVQIQISEQKSYAL